MTTFNALSGEPFTKSMALAAGISPHQIRHLVRTGVLHQLLHSVYVGAGTPDSIDLRARAAALVLPDHAVVSDLSAAWLHGISLVDYAALDVPPDLDAVSVGGPTAPRRQGVFGGKRDLQADEITTIGGVRVTTALRTACDIACLRGRLRAIATLDAFRKEFGITEQALHEKVERFAGRRGVVQLRELAPLSCAEADSQPESWVRLLIHDEGLPTPAPQVWTLLPTWGYVRTENAYEHLKIAVEYDGEEFHTTDADQEHDRERRRALRDAGWIIIVIRKDAFSRARRTAWLHELSDAIRSREPEQLCKRVYSRDPRPSPYRRKGRRRR